MSFRFEKLEIFKEAIEFAADVYKAVKKFPDSEKYISSCYVLFAICYMLIVSEAVLKAESVEDIRILKIFPQDHKAIIMTPESKTDTVKVGDLIDPYGKVIEIVEGRIVLEKKSQVNIETVIIRVEDGKQRVERISKFPDKQPTLYVPR